jgi:hypothetical protein
LFLGAEIAVTDGPGPIALSRLARPKLSSLLNSGESTSRMASMHHREPQNQPTVHDTSIAPEKDPA